MTTRVLVRVEDANYARVIRPTWARSTGPGSTTPVDLIRILELRIWRCARSNVLLDRSCNTLGVGEARPARPRRLRRLARRGTRRGVLFRVTERTTRERCSTIRSIRATMSLRGPIRSVASLPSGIFSHAPWPSLRLRNFGRPASAVRWCD